MADTTFQRHSWRDLTTPLGILRIEVWAQTLTSLSWLGDTKDSAQPQTEEPWTNDAKDRALLENAARQLEEYFAGQRRSFDLPVRAEGTNFQEQVWRVLASVPYGHTWSYQQLARTAGLTRAVRAVAQAVAANPLAIVIPCHRIVRSDGTLGGYAGGRARKRWLLDLEQHGAI